MTLRKSFICPKCGNEKIAILNSGVILEDVRMDYFRCPKCETEWKVYSKTAEVNTEVTYVAAPKPVEEPSEDSTTTE